MVDLVSRLTGLKSVCAPSPQDIANSLAVEFDTYHNFEEIEPYENHISVQTRGWLDRNSANHRCA